MSGRSSTKSGQRLSEGRTKVKTNNKKKIGKKFNLTLDFSKINQQMMSNQISQEEQVSRNLPSTIPNLNQYNMAAQNTEKFEGQGLMTNYPRMIASQKVNTCQVSRNNS